MKSRERSPADPGLRDRARSFAEAVSREAEQQFAAELAANPLDTRSELARAMNRAILKRRPGRPREATLDTAAALFAQGCSDDEVVKRCIPELSTVTYRAQRKWLRKTKNALEQRARRAAPSGSSERAHGE